MLDSLTDDINIRVTQELVKKKDAFTNPREIYRAVKQCVVTDDIMMLREKFYGRTKLLAETIEDYANDIYLLGSMLKVDKDCIKAVFLNGLPNTISKGAIMALNDKDMDWKSLVNRATRAISQDDAKSQRSLGKRREREQLRHGTYDRPKRSSSPENVRPKRKYRGDQAPSRRKDDRKYTEGCWECGGNHMRRDCPNLQKPKNEEPRV